MKSSADVDQNSVYIEDSNRHRSELVLPKKSLSSLPFVGQVTTLLPNGVPVVVNGITNEQETSELVYEDFDAQKKDSQFIQTADFFPSHITETSILHLLILKNCPGLVTFAADPCHQDVDGNNLMHLLCEHSLHVAIASILEQSMIDLPKLVKMMETTNNDDGSNNTIFVAILAKSKLYHTMEYLIQVMPTCQCAGYTPMHIAVRKDDLYVVNLLLKIEFNLDIKDSTALKTPLMYARQQGNVELARTLINHGADVSIKDNSSFASLKVNDEIERLFENEKRKRRRNKVKNSKKCGVEN